MSIYSTKNIRQEGKEILRCAAQNIFSIDSFCTLQITTQQRQSDFSTCQTMWHSSGISTDLAWHQTSIDVFSQRRRLTNTQSTQYMLLLLSYLTTKLALWREYEPDRVPELPQFTLVCHSRGILNTPAKTFPIRNTDKEQYMCTYTYYCTWKYPHAAVVSCPKNYWDALKTVLQVYGICCSHVCEFAYLWKWRHVYPAITHMLYVENIQYFASVTQVKRLKMQSAH